MGLYIEQGMLFRTISSGDFLIVVPSTSGGHMILVNKGRDVEIYSGTSKGAVQGYGYVFHAKDTYGPRILRLVGTSDFSVHDIALVDCKCPSPTLFNGIDIFEQLVLSTSSWILAPTARFTT
jgi:hypothetical protein